MSGDLSQFVDSANLCETKPAKKTGSTGSDRKQRSESMFAAAACSLGRKSSAVPVAMFGSGTVFCGAALSFSSKHDVECDALTDRHAAIAKVLSGESRVVEFNGSSITTSDTVSAKLVLPGSFNPLHRGHQGMMDAARNKTSNQQSDCVFELAVKNADKGTIDLAEIEKRVQPFVDSSLRLCITTSPMFSQKSEVFPGSAFVVGAVHSTRPARSSD